MDGRCRERFAGPPIGRGRKVGLEAPRLFDVEAPELAPFDVFLEAFDRARGGVDRCIVAPLGVFQIDEVARFTRSFSALRLVMFLEPH